MNIHPDLIPNLRRRLDENDAIAMRLHDLISQVSKAEGAAARLREQLAAIGAQAEEAARIHIPADADRVAQLISGAEVPQLDRKEIEARALKSRQLDAQRQQLSDDLAAVEAHLSALNRSASNAQQRAEAGELAFLSLLGDALADAFRRDARKFIAAHIPGLSVVAKRLAERSADAPEWQHILSAVTIHWYEGEPTKETVHHPAVRKHVALWPRSDGVLVTGEPVISDSLIASLIDAIRASPASASAAGAD